MKPLAKLSEIVEYIDMGSDDAESFYNELTGEFYYYHEGFTDDERDLDEEEGWLRLPNQREADEYRMMSDFSSTVRNARKREQLEIALSGRGAFRRFKDAVSREGIDNEWYVFRDKRYLAFARNWCEGNGIPYDPAELPNSEDDDHGDSSEAGITIGKTASATALVDESNTAKAVGSGSLEVFATPMMISLMESAACKCLVDGLEDGQSSVGTAISVEHTAASPLGAEITATAVIVGVGDRKIEFEVSACDAKGEIGRGTHERYIVAVDRFMARVGSRL